MSNKLTINQMTAQDAKQAGISTLADRPNSASRYGDGGLTAKALKERFDALPNLVREKFNEIAKMLDDSDAAKYITLDKPVGEIDNLYDFLLLFGARGTSEADKNISDYIQTLYQREDSNSAESTTLVAIVADIVERLTAAKTAHGALADGVVEVSLSASDENKTTLTLKLKSSAGEEKTLTFTAGGPVKSAGIDDGAVTADKIATGAVTGTKIADGAVSSDKLESTLKKSIDGAFKEVGYDAETGVLTFVANGGETKEIDLPLELLVRGGRFDKDTEETVFILADGTEIRVPFNNFVEAVFKDVTALKTSFKAAELSGEKLILTSHEGEASDVDLSKLGFLTAEQANDLYLGMYDLDYTLEEMDATDKEHGHAIEEHSKRLDNIEAHIRDDYFVTDASVEYRKNVSINACSYARLLSFGGATYQDEETQELRDSAVTEIISHGRNIWDEQTTGATLNKDTGVAAVSAMISSKNYIPCEPNTKYYFYVGGENHYLNICFYNADKEFISILEWNAYRTGEQTTPDGCYFMKFNCSSAYGTVYKNDICISRSDELNGTYTPYREPISYPIPDSIFYLDGYGKSGFTFDLAAKTCSYGDDVWIEGEDYDYMNPFFEVEGGGSLEFVNEHGQAVPSTVKYLLKEDSI